MGVTRDKIPLVADVLSGNKDDKAWNKDVITTILYSIGKHYSCSGQCADNQR
ncbi:MAG: hypothetical protein PWQ37_2850 [Candidatus Petromonas sp.]|jgi:transposase|nr:hypothetical protein [Candidatus Petromonas sp.]